MFGKKGENKCPRNSMDVVGENGSMVKSAIVVTLFREQMFKQLKMADVLHNLLVLSIVGFITITSQLGDFGKGVTFVPKM